jgi:hypothetical protein
MDLSTLNGRAMLISIGVGVGIALIIAVGGGLLIGFSALGMLGSAGPENIIASMGAFGGLLLCVCCLVLGLCIGQGALYASLAHRFGDPIDVGHMAVGGALTSLITTLLFQVLSVALVEMQSIVVGTFTFQSLISDLTGQAVAFCIYPFLYIALGAIGGAIYAGIAQNRAKTSTPLG